MNNQEVKIGSTIKLNRRQQVTIQAREIYLSDDIPCNLKGCAFCNQSGELTSLDDGQIFIIDTEILEQYIDLIEQSSIKNMIILQTQVTYFRKKSQQVMNMIEANFSKSCYIYQNEFSTHTQGEYPIISLALWYTQHKQFLKQKFNVKLLSQNYRIHELAKSKQIDVQTIQDYVRENESNQDLMDYLGMEEEDEIKDMIFEEHLSIEACLKMIRQGLLFEGRISVDRNDINSSRIIVRQFNLEIKIQGSLHQNRSLHGDRVAVRLLPENEWHQVTKQFNIEEDEDLDETNETSERGIDVGHLQSLFQKIQSQKLQPYGHVVGILQRTPKQYCGHVVDSLFFPADGRYPNFKLRHPRLHTLQDMKLLVQFTEWQGHQQYPQAKLKKVLGKAGDAYVEGNVILLEHEVEIREFSHQVIACLPGQGDKFTIPSDEIARRWDLRSLEICSIDPVGCKDIDDALHCRQLEDGNLEVGVHIADVSYFVQADSAIDREAAHRCTTVYLVDRRTDMLPKLLTENLCSLVSQVDRLAFSVIWTFNKDQIVDVKFGKSVIRSKASLNYGQAQQMIDDVNDNSSLTQSIRWLNQIGKALKAQRIQAGALTLASNQVHFSFDAETHNPTDVRMYQLYDTNSLVEEFMLLANVSVAEKILSRFPAISILRRHQQPKVKQIQELQELLGQMGYKLEYNTSKELNDSLNSITREDQFFNKLVRMMTTRCMNEALYICTADVDFPELFHYGLAAQLYTHFTSPIRRYADVLVHRLLAAAIDLQSLPASMSNKIRMSRICDKMNMRHRNARFASRASSDYHTYLFFKNQPKQQHPAIITGITQKGATVLLPRYGLEGLVPATLVDDPLKVQIDGQLYKIFDYIQVYVEVELKNFHKKITLRT